MSKYIYKRYACHATYANNSAQTSYNQYSNLPTGTVYRPYTNNPSLEPIAISQSLSVDTSAGYYCNNSATKIGVSEYLYSGVLYLLIRSAVEAWSLQGNNFTIAYSQNASNGVKLMNKYTLTPIYVQDAYIDEVMALDGAYPDDGYNAADGYWYVKDRVAILPYAYINGIWRETQPSVRVNGVWHSADMTARVNGAWLN